MMSDQVNFCVVVLCTSLVGNLLFFSHVDSEDD